MFWVRFPAGSRRTRSMGAVPNPPILCGVEAVFTATCSSVRLAPVQGPLLGRSTSSSPLVLELAPGESRVPAESGPWRPGIYVPSVVPSRGAGRGGPLRRPSPITASVCRSGAVSRVLRIAQRRDSVPPLTRHPSGTRITQRGTPGKRLALKRFRCWLVPDVESPQAPIKPPSVTRRFHVATTRTAVLVCQ